MNKLKKILALATISLASTGSVSLADSSNFSGPFIGVGHSIAGIELKGQYIDPTMVDNTTNNGAVGMIGGFAQGTAGWGVPVGDMFHVVLGASYTPSGDAEFAANAARAGAHYQTFMSSIGNKTQSDVSSSPTEAV